MAASVEAALEVLVDEGFQALPQPLVVGGATFDFDAAARGTGVSHDLVILSHSTPQHRRLPQLVSGLARTLDRLHSRRPVTLLLMGDPPGRAQLEALEQFARVLLLPSDDPSRDEVRAALAVLLPLDLPETTDTTIDARAELQAELSSASPEHNQLIESSLRGEDAVRQTLRTFISDAVEPHDGACRWFSPSVHCA